MNTFHVNGDTVLLIGLDVPKLPRLSDEMLWRLYKVNVLGIWPGEPDEDEQPEKDQQEGGKS